MKIIKQDYKNNQITVKIHNEDDLWYLSHVIEESDEISGRTTRRVSVGKKEGERRPMHIRIIVENIKFAKFTNYLRVSGKIVECSDEKVGMGDYHTFNITSGTIIRIKKNKWFKYHKDFIKKAVKQTFKPRILLVSCDYGRASFAFMHGYGMRKAGSLIKQVGGKREYKDYEQNKRKFEKKLLSRLNQIVKQKNINNVIIGGVGFINKNLKKKLGNYKHLEDRVVFTKIYSAGDSGFKEILKKKIVDKIYESSLMVKEEKLIKELLKRIGKNTNATYGYEHVKKAVSYGAVNHLLITNELIKDYRKKEEYEEIDKMMTSVEESRGSIHIIPSDTEQGEKLGSLGGIAVLTRYKVE